MVQSRILPRVAGEGDQRSWWRGRPQAPSPTLPLAGRGAQLEAQPRSEAGVGVDEPATHREFPGSPPPTLDPSPQGGGRRLPGRESHTHNVIRIYVFFPTPKTA